MAAAAAAEVPFSIKEVYEAEDRNFLLVTAVVTERVIEIRDKAMQESERKHG